MLSALGLAARWRERAAALAGYADPAAKAFAIAADELEHELQQGPGALLTATEAARRTGYTPDHIRRLVREGRVPNRALTGPPRVRLEDLPRKIAPLPPSPDPGQVPGTSRRAVARAVVADLTETRDGQALSNG